MNTRFLFVVGWIFVGMTITMTTIITTTTDAAAVVVTSRHRSSPPPPNSWFREKYLVASYDIYHDYMLYRCVWDDNDIDKCPDIYNGASLYAITGRHIYPIKRTCHVLPKSADTDTITPIPISIPIPIPDLRIVYLMLVDALQRLFQISCYIFEIVLNILSIVLATCFTLFMIILLFCQY